MTETLEKYEIKNNWTDAVIVTAQINATPDMLASVKLGLAVRWGLANSADLRDADLRGTSLRGADLRGAYLYGANLTDEQLRPIIADLWFILSQARREVPAMVTALRTGNVDGSTYTGICACLVGTLENAGAVDLPHVAESPAERWFLSIRKGDKPGDASAGGFAAGKALEWIEQYCRLTGIVLEPAA